VYQDIETPANSISTLLSTTPIVETSDALASSLLLSIVQSNSVIPETTDGSIKKHRKRIHIDNALLKLKERCSRELDNTVDPLNLLNDFANIPWNNNQYRNQKFKEYDWSLLPPYIRLLLNNKGSINLLSMPEPSITVLNQVYSMMSIIHNEKSFYSILMTHIEKNQLKNYIEVIWKDLILADQMDSESLLPKIVEFSRHQRYPHSPAVVSEIYKWFMFPPFLYIHVL